VEHDSSLSDSELVTAGDYEQLIARYEPAVNKYARQYATNVSYIDDFKQAARIAIWEKASQYDPQRGVSFKTYIISHIKYALLKERADICSGGTCNSSVYIRKKLDPIMELTDRHMDRHAVEIGGLPNDFEKHDEVQYFLNKLKDRDHNIVKDYYFENTTYAQLGTRYGISKQRIGQIIKKGLEIMEKYA
jgi:RNA polymerase sigma factor (sigma-70 family)